MENESAFEVRSQKNCQVAPRIQTLGRFSHEANRIEKIDSFWGFFFFLLLVKIRGFDEALTHTAIIHMTSNPCDKKFFSLFTYLFLANSIYDAVFCIFWCFEFQNNKETFLTKSYFFIFALQPWRTKQSLISSTFAPCQQKILIKNSSFLTSLYSDTNFTKLFRDLQKINFSFAFFL